MDALNFMNLTVSFYDGRVMNPAMVAFAENIFKNKNGPSFLNMILNTDIGPKFNIINIDTVEKIETKPFRDFQFRHESMDYTCFFENKANQKDYFQKNRKSKGQIVHHYTENKKCKNQVHPAQIRDSFTHILFKIVSNQLLGNNRNKKKILKHLHNLLKTARTESFSVLSLLKQLNVSSISWFNCLNDQQKYILLAKFIKWLFQYIIVVINDQYKIFYIKEQRIFIHQKDFRKQESQHMKKLLKTFTIEPDDAISMNQNINKLTLALKKTGLRTIIRNKCLEQEKEALKKALCILTYLKQTYLSNVNNNFIEKYIEIVKEHKISNSSELYIVSSDIVNAYESIKINKLYNIIKELFEILPSELQLQWEKVNNCKRFKYLDGKNLLQKKKGNIEIIKKKDIFLTIEGSIYNTTFAYNKKLYYLCKGIGQGLILSPILCDIYYSSMRKKYFSSFEKEGFLYYYVDDSFYMTKNRNFAEDYLKILLKGIPEYNCWFNKSKLKTNFSETDDVLKCSTFNYLYWNINCNTLEVKPKYGSARYSTIYTSLPYRSVDYKMLNLTGLNINKLLLCKEINSEKQLLNNIKSIVQQHAERCFSWILYNYLQNPESKCPIKTLQTGNRRLFRRIKKLTNWDKSKVNHYYITIKYMIWKTFYRTFSKKSNIFLKETKIFKNFMKYYEKFLS